MTDTKLVIDHANLGMRRAVTDHSKPDDIGSAEIPKNLQEDFERNRGKHRHVDRASDYTRLSSQSG